MAEFVIDIFTWWMICISFSILFITLIAVYIYTANRPKRVEQGLGDAEKQISIGVKFIFIWVLVGLLVFYIISVYLDSIPLFAIGNVAVEILLLLYLVKNKTLKDEEL